MLAPLANFIESAEGEFGPITAGLPTAKMRAFVVAMYEVPPGRGATVRAAVLAGYGTPTTTRKALSVIAARLSTDERIQAAIAEEGRRRFRTLGPIAHFALKNLLLDPAHKDHGKAVMACLNHAMPLETRHLHEHQHQHQHFTNGKQRAAEAVKHFTLLRDWGATEEMLIKMFGYSGWSRYRDLADGKDTLTIDHDPSNGAPK